MTGPGVRPRPDGIEIPTSHVDLVPTLLGLAGIDPTDAAQAVAHDHDQTRPLPGRDLSRVVTGVTELDDVRAPIYFMTEDDVTRGTVQVNIFTNTPYEAVSQPSKVESVVALLPSGPDATDELWKLVHYYERLDAWHESQGQAIDPTAPPAAEPFWELHNLTTDPEERHNLAPQAPPALATMQSTLEEQRAEKRLLPKHTAPSS
jgi:arylsulfatase A-like enzyme